MEPLYWDLDVQVALKTQRGLCCSEPVGVFEIQELNSNKGRGVFAGGAGYIMAHRDIHPRSTSSIANAEH